MPTALQGLCALFECQPSILIKYFRDPEKRQEAINFLSQKALFRNYGTLDSILCHGITQNAAQHTPAYNGFLRINIPQHFYCTHNLKLHFPLLPCIIQKGGNKHRDYFPLELIKYFD